MHVFIFHYAHIGFIHHGTAAKIIVGVIIQMCDDADDVTFTCHLNLVLCESVQSRPSKIYEHHIRLLFLPTIVCEK